MSSCIDLLICQTTVKLEGAHSLCMEHFFWIASLPCKSRVQLHLNNHLQVVELPMPNKTFTIM